MFRIFVINIYLAACTSGAFAQAPAPQTDGAAQAIGLFMQVCVRLKGNPEAVRDFLKQKGVHELTPEASSVFVGSRKGIGFDATNKVTRMAVVSEDNGWCTVFAETVDITKVEPLFSSIVTRAGLKLSKTNKEDHDGGLKTQNYKLTIGDHEYSIGISVGDRPNAPYHAALTIAP